jgi:hypothetical protein
VQFVHPRIQLAENGQRASSALLGSRVRIEVALFAVGFDQVQVGEVLERDRGPPVFGQQCIMELGGSNSGGKSNLASVVGRVVSSDLPSRRSKTSAHAVPEYRLSKFQRVLPDAWQVEMVVAYLLDFERTEGFLWG